MSLRAKAANAIRRGYPPWLVQRWLQATHQRRRAQNIPMAGRAPRMNRGGWGRRRGPSKSQMERSIGRAKTRDERRDKVAAERFARTKHPETALKHETGLLRKEHGKRADPLIEQLEKGYDIATKIKEKREARRDKRLGDAHAREVAKGEAGKKHAEMFGPKWAAMLGLPHRQTWGPGDKKPYPGWKIRSLGMMWPGFNKHDETKEEYVARLGQRGTTPQGYSVHIPHRLHGASEEQVKKYLDYHGRNMAKEEFAWRKRTALAKWKSKLRRDRMRERDNWYV